MANDQAGMTDRELLIKMATEIGFMRGQIVDLKEEFKSLAQRHASKSDVEKLERSFTETKVALERSFLETKMAVDKIIRELPQRFVTQEEFALVRKLVYGAVVLILMAVVGSIIRLVVIG